MKNGSPTPLVVLVNTTPVLEYDRTKTLSESQRQSLLHMNEKLNQGISLGNKHIKKPSPEQRIEFVTANMISAILNEEEKLAAASCAYVALSLPELKQVKAFEKSGEISIELVFDREYQEEEKLNFVPLENINK